MVGETTETIAADTGTSSKDMASCTIVQQLDGNDVGLSYIQQAGDTSAITTGSQYAGDPVTGGTRGRRRTLDEMVRGAVLWSSRQ